MSTAFKEVKGLAGDLLNELIDRSLSWTMVRVQSGPPTQIPAPVAELSEIRARGRHVGQVQGDEDDLAFKLALAESANQQLREALKQNNEDMRRQLEVPMVGSHLS